MTIYEIVCMIGLIITHAAVYNLGKSAVFEPSDEAWLEAKKYSLDRALEYYKWLEERKNHHADETETAAPSGD